MAKYQQQTMSIIAEAPGFFQVFSDGYVKRFELPNSPPSEDFTDGYKSKDIILDLTKPVTARVFVPDTRKNPVQHLPVLLYCHGGGFAIGSTKWSGVHAFLGGLCAKCRVVILSVDYRLAPENRLPAAYEDCYSSLQWLQCNTSIETGLENADLSRVFLAGESAGGNIVHNVMLYFIKEDIPGINIKGLITIHPFFGSEERISSELDNDMDASLKMSDLFWRLSLPEGSNRDHFWCNFKKGEQSEMNWGRLPAVEVFVAGKDLLKERGIMYGEFLKRNGIKAEVVMHEDETHAYHVFNPDSEGTHLMQSQIAKFIEQHK